MTIVDFPEQLLPSVEISWQMDTNNSSKDNPYTGQSLEVRGLKQRWRFSLKFRELTRDQGDALEEFFMKLEGSLNVFRMRDPSRPVARGNVATSPTLALAAAQFAQAVRLTFVTSAQPALKSGDWLQLPSGQATKVQEDVDTSGGLTQDVKIWPHLWLGETLVGNTVVANNTAGSYGIFRLVRDAPAWSSSVANKARPIKSGISAEQVILTETV